MEFHEKLQELRKNKGITQEELAENLYVSRTAISKWESGRGYPSIDSLKAISRYFSVTIDELICPEEIMIAAKEEKENTMRKYGVLICSLLDVFTVVLFAIPMYEMTDIVTEILPQDKPRYLMGVGTPWNIIECIALGVDMFDCVMPTRNARNAMLFTWNGVINMKNAKWKDCYEPLDPSGTSYVDSYYTKAYVRHLFNAQESLGKQIASIHNLAFYLELVRVAREHIIAGDFAQWKEQIVPQLKQRL